MRSDNIGMEVVVNQILVCYFMAHEHYGGSYPPAAIITPPLRAVSKKPLGRLFSTIDEVEAVTSPKLTLTSAAGRTRCRGSYPYTGTSPPAAIVIPLLRAVSKKAAEGGFFRPLMR